MTNKKSKRLTVTGIALSVALAVSALGTIDSANAAGSKHLNLGMIYYESDVNAFQEMAFGGDSVANAYGNVSLTSAAPSTEDPAKELQLFQSAANVSKDGVVLQTLAGSTFLRAVKAVTARKIPVIEIDAPLPAGSGSNLFITNDNVGLGYQVASALLAKIPAGTTGEVVITTNGAAVPPLQQRVQGMQQAIKQLRPDLTVVGPLTTGNTSTANLSSIQSILNAHPNALAFMSPDDQDPESIATVSQNTGVKYNAGGCDLEAAALQGVKGGYITVLGSPEHYLKGAIAMNILINHATKGTPIPTGVFLAPQLLVNSANVDSVIARESSNKSRDAFFAKTVAAQTAALYKSLSK